MNKKVIKIKNRWINKERNGKESKWRINIKNYNISCNRTKYD